MGVHTLLMLVWRGLDSIMTKIGRLDSWLNLAYSAFNQLNQYTSSPGRRGYCLRRTRRFP